MPNRDGTGPLGVGSMTGRGAGRCGRGLGLGRRFGGGRGRGWGGVASVTEIGAADEKQMLREQAQMLQAQLDSIKMRVEGLDADETAK